MAGMVLGVTVTDPDGTQTDHCRRTSGIPTRKPEATAIHWHGMELESFYDGVHGWSGAGQRLTPLIEPGETFAVRFTPPRAGTFMYHTHLHDGRQLAKPIRNLSGKLAPGIACG